MLKPITIVCREDDDAGPAPRWSALTRLPDGTRQHRARLPAADTGGGAADGDLPGTPALAAFLLEQAADGWLATWQPDSLAELFRETGDDGHAERSLIDLGLLCRLSWPHWPRHDAQEAARQLPDLDGLPASDTCARGLALLDAALEVVRKLPAGLRGEWARLLGPTGYRALRDLLRNAGDGATDPSAATSLVNCFAHVPSRRHRAPAPPPTADPPAPLDPAHIAELLGPQGPFAARAANYEYRGQQIDMAQAVAGAFNDGRHLLVEAGTGVGKSMAYLTPAALWATSRQEPVIVSTNTKNLQSQLFARDLPLVRAALDLPFEAALIKGRQNYLCLRRLFAALDQAGLDGDDRERACLAVLLGWAVRTTTGDLAEAPLGEAPRRTSVASRLTCGSDECMGPRCRFRARCFVNLARRRAREADLVVANHAVVFSEMDLDEKSAVLPPYAHVVFDEAHNLEENATRWLSVEVSAGRLLSVLHRLGPSSRPRHGGGIVAALLREASSCTAFRSEKRREDTVASLRALLAALRECEPLAERCFESMAALLPDDPDRTSLHVNAATKAREAWLPVEAATRNLDAALEKLPRALDAAARPLLELEVPPTSPLPDLLQDLAAAAGALEGFRADLAFVLAAGDEAYVFWIEPADRAATTARAMAAPIEVGPRLADALYSKKRGVIFCSATLTAGGRFDYFRQRLGLDRLEPDAVRELNVGTPFDYRRQCAVLVPSFLPEPVAKGGDYTGAVCRLLADTFERTRGRALVLFTSYRMLREVHGQLEPLLRPLGIDVLAQSISGSRERILERFAHDVESVLLGTHSFWEGVDVPGESLSCVVVARLPFAVLTDPVFEARCKRIEEQGGNAFADFSVPAAVVRFRQGFGRLIRHRTDCGLVLVTDKRIVTRRYGTWFRRSLPVPVTTVDTPEQFGERVATFVDAMQSGVFSS